MNDAAEDDDDDDIGGLYSMLPDADAACVVFGEMLDAPFHLDPCVFQRTLGD